MYPVTFHNVRFDQSCPFSSKDDQDSFSHPETAADGLFALKDPELLAPEKDVDIFVMVSLTTQPNEVEQQRERLSEQKEKHAGVVHGSCRAARSASSSAS